MTKMTRLRLSVLLLLFAMSGYVATPWAQESREAAIAHMDKPDPKVMDATYNKTAPMAQKLVDNALAEHPEILLVGIHAGAPKYWMVASNFGRLGKLGDEDDLRCIRTGKAHLEPHPDVHHYEVELRLKDRTGRTVGAVAMVFRYEKGDDPANFLKIATSVRDEMMKQTQSTSSLFGPAN